MKPIVSIQKLGKRYRLGQREPYKTLRESISSSVRAPFRRFRPNAAKSAATGAPDHIWALRDLSLDVMPGEVLGVIGRNGAGKSTLLKILSRITEPTTGRAALYGRVGSLLEVGTGFHPELTGGENIYLSGAILGMKRDEIRRKFDEIVAFAEIGDFVDTPVKHYSSGMYVRLAFAVAAHLETEILLVDEVLAVGDIAFQKKCLGKMGDIARHGRTVLFVSHNMAAIESLCSSCLLLAGGGVEVRGEPSRSIARYMALALGDHLGGRSLIAHPGRRTDSVPAMRSITLCSGDETPTGILRMDAPLSIRVSFSAPRPVRPVLGLTVKTSQGAPVFHVSDRYSNQLFSCEPTQSGTVICEIERLPLMPGRYVLDLWFGDHGDQVRDLDMIADATSFEVTPVDLLGTSRLPSPTLGAVFWSATWRLRNGSKGAIGAPPDSR